MVLLTVIVARVRERLRYGHGPMRAIGTKTALSLLMGCCCWVIRMIAMNCCDGRCGPSVRVVSGGYLGVRRFTR